MSVSGICSICGKASPNIHTCELCGQNVCESDYVVEEGVCKQCISRRGI